MKTRPIHALVGDDTFLQLEALRSLLAQLPEGTQRVDFEGESAELADVFDELRSYSMFGEGKLVVIRDADPFLTRFREQLEDYVAKPSDSATLALRLNSLPKQQRIYKAIVKTGVIVECAPPKDVRRWILDRAKHHQLALAPDAAAMLFDYIGDDLGRLDNELAKLALQTDTNKITAADITGGVAFQREQEMRDMTSQVAIGNTAGALKKWRQLIALDSSAEFRAVTWLSMWLEDVGVVLNGSQAGINSLSWKYKNGLQPFIAAARALGKSRHARAYDLLAQIDKQSKSGVGNAADNVERFLLSLSI